MLKEFRRSLGSLSVYRNTLHDPLVSALRDCLTTASGGYDELEIIDSFHRFMFTYFSTAQDFPAHLVNLVLHDDNPFSRAAEIMTFNEIDPRLIQAAVRDLQILGAIKNLDMSVLAISLWPQNKFPPSNPDSLPGYCGEPGLATRFTIKFRPAAAPGAGMGALPPRPLRSDRPPVH
jgi:hypothetical protein